ncbi:MAG: spondin domain-containing protein [Balneolaceae bacterium]|nr:spondin domain-containing protein [Balneolaceae bacterium]
MKFIQTAGLIIISGLFALSCVNDTNNEASGRFTVTLENTSPVYDLVKSGSFAVPAGASDPAPIFPGEAYEFEFTAPAGSRLTFATMFVQSNDWIYATDEEGVALFNEDGSKVTGDITSQVDLYDAGTEADQEPGTGSDQAPRQTGPDTGADDPDSSVREVSDNGLPADSEVIKVTITDTGGYGFKVRIENVSDGNTLQTSEGSVAVPLSPGVFAVHGDDLNSVLFELGSDDYGDGLESIAEDGDPSTLASSLEERTGVTTPLAPGAFAIFRVAGENPLFTAGAPAPGNGLEEMAEDGDPSVLGSGLGGYDNVSISGVFNTPDGASGPGPIFPGQSYSFTFEAEEGDLLTFGTMYVQSNDLFYAPQSAYLELFQNGNPLNGDITSQIILWDAGTEINQEPGIGSDQAPRQAGPDTGAADQDNSVRPVSDNYDYEDAIKVTISVQ